MFDNMPRKFGKIKVQGGFFKAATEDMLLIIFHKMIVVETHYEPISDIYTFSAYCPEFSEIAMGEEIPLYHIQIGLNDADSENPIPYRIIERA